MNTSRAQELSDLKKLQQQGLISVSDFARMATDVKAFTEGDGAQLVGKSRHQIPHMGGCGAHRLLLHAKLGGCRACLFSLLKLCFGYARVVALADMIQASLMLMYSQRATGHAD